MAEEQSVSQGWRDKGNRSYRNFVDSPSNGRKKSYLEMALQSYYRAFETADTDEDKSRAAKNYAMGAYWLARVLGNLDEPQSLIEFRFREAINYFSKATFVGQRSMDAEWLDGLLAKYTECVGRAIESFQGLPCRERVVAIEKFTQVMVEDSQRAACFLEMATTLSQAGVAALGIKDFRTALQHFHDCYRPVQECYRLTAQTGDIYKEAKVIDADVGFHMATAEAIQAIYIGDDTLKAALENSDTLSMDLVYDAMDWYKKAVINTREIEVEMEAMAVSRLGSLYDKVLKMKSKAKDYFSLCMQLATSLQPRNFGTEPWFKTCVDALQRFQSEAVNNDESIRQAEREKYIAELATELKDIRGADVEGSSAKGLLRFLYEKYPPKNPEHKLDGTDLDKRTKMKKTLLTAIQHYHPDKQDSETHGKKWKILCEEITKLLNRRYESYKFPPEETTTSTAA